MQLVVQSGAEPGRTYDLATTQKVVIGRQSGNDVVVPDEQVSRKHAEVEERNGTLIVTDLNSSNGTFVNGTRIGSPQVLRNGDTVQVGTTVLRVMEAQTGAPTLPTSTNYRQAAQDAGYANPNYGASPASTPDKYSQPPNYAQPTPPTPGYGQAGYGAQPPAAGAYDNSYNQPGAYNQNQAAQGYGAPPSAPGYDPNQAYGQMQGYGAQPQPAYSAQPGYGAPQPASYSGPAPAPARAKKGLPLALIGIIGVVIIAAVALLLIFVVFAGGGAVGDLPAPKNSTKLDVSVTDLAKASTTTVPAGVDINKYKFGVYSTTEKPDAVINFYKDEMKKKGWTEEAGTSGGGSITFVKGDQTASVFSGALDSQLAIDGLSKALPALKDKFKVGDTFVLNGQGPKN